MSLDTTEIAIIGGGFGGLSCACYLADMGASVTVVERNEQLGGRARRLRTERFRFDMGPSWYLMPDVFERFFGHFDHKPSDFYELERLDPRYRVFFKDGDRVDIPDSTEAIEEVFASYEAEGDAALRRYLDRAERVYELGLQEFVYTDRNQFRDYLDPSLVRYLRNIDLLRTMDAHVARYVDHPKLRQILQYSLVFLGGAPHNTPALYMLMSHVDLNLGVYYPAGGIGAVVDGLVELGESLGVDYRTGFDVTSIDKSGPQRWTVTDETRTVPGECVVSNAGYRHTEQDLLAPAHRQYDAEYWADRTYAPSAACWYWGVEGRLPGLEHHNLVLPLDWSGHFDSLFDDREWPADPAYYVCVPSRTDADVAPADHEAVFALVPVAPGLDDTERRMTRFRDQILTDIERHVGVDIRDQIVFEHEFSISDFAADYNSPKGTALGLAHTLRQTGPLRPGRRSTAVDGLYYVGADTTPGIGVPMCLISGEHTAAAIRRDVGADG